MYTVFIADEARDFASRSAAIDAAKDLSERRRVDIVDEDGKELLRYRHGELETYVYELRPGRSVER